MNKKGMWTTRRGKEIKIKDMTDEHLYNTICYLTGRIMLDPIEKVDSILMYGTKGMEEKIKEMKREFKRRK